MKVINLILVSFMWLSCELENEKKVIVEEQPQTKSLNADSLSEMLIYKDIKGLYAEVKVTAQSIDSIFAIISIINNSTSDITIYKPVFPYKNLVENYFDFMDSNFHHLNFYVDSDSQQKYYSQKFSPPVVIPNFNIKENFSILKANEQLNFKLNISENYDFKTFIEKGTKTFNYHFFIHTPLIENNVHVWELDPFRKVYRPVYLTIGATDSIQKIITIPDK